MSSAPELDRVLEAAVEHGGAVLVDLSELTFMDSTGINAFLKAALSLRGRGCLVLHGEQDRVRRVLDLVRVDGFIPNLHRLAHGVREPANGARTEVLADLVALPMPQPSSNQTFLPMPSASTPHDAAIVSTRNSPQPLGPGSSPAPVGRREGPDP